MSLVPTRRTEPAVPLHKLQHALIVSAQASSGEPLCSPEHICALALSGLNGGARGLRLEGAHNVEFVRRHTDVPIIGLTKLEIPENERLDRVYITGTFSDAQALAAAGADIIAIDATGRPRPDGGSLKDLINGIKTELNKPVWADVSTFEEGATAADYGADVVSTTMFGYTKETLRPPEAGPDFELLERFCQHLPALIVLEGRVWHPEEVTRAFQLGAHAVVVGSAITRPQLITKRFVQAIPVV